jgi:hypothetical protein
MKSIIKFTMDGIEKFNRGDDTNEPKTNSDSLEKDNEYNI